MVDARQTRQRVIERQQRFSLLVERQRLVGERNANRRVSAFGRASPPRVLDEDAPHRTRGNSKEVRAILPRDLTVAGDELQVRFVNEIRGGKRVLVSLLTQSVVSNVSKMFVNELKETLFRLLITVAPLLKASGNGSSSVYWTRHPANP